MVSGTRSDGFKDKGISGGDGVGQKPEWNHPRKIKWDDRSHHSQRLPDHHLVDAASYIFKVVALHHHRNAASYLDVFDGPAPLSFGFGEGLAVFLSQDAAQFVDMFFEKLLQLE